MRSTLMLLFVLIFPIISSFIGYIIGTKNERYRDIFNIAVTGIIFVIVTLLYKPVSIQPIDISISHIMGTGVHLRLDVFRYVFLWITSLIWFLTTIYSIEYFAGHKKSKKRNRYYMFFMLTLGSTVGVFISENFLNLFTFFEIMSFTSYVLIIHDEDDYSHDAGYTYIVMAVIGGLMLLMGLFLLYNYTQTLDISKLYSTINKLGNVKYVISSLIIIGFGVKAGMIPLHIWLPKAHPAAPAPASGVLSGILLKTGVFGIILTTDIILKEDFFISIIILVIGFMNMFVGGFLAMFQRNIKRILAYSSMSQIGYILMGVGLIGILREHNTYAIYGTVFHVVNHAIFKVLLFMCAGAVYMITHELNINKIVGVGRNNLVLKVIFLIGILATVGMPGFNGYISKTLLHKALAEAHIIYHTELFVVAEVIFTLSSSFTVAYLLKLFVTIFIEKSNNSFECSNGKSSKFLIIPMSVLSVLIVYIGLNPNTVLHILDGALKTFGDVHHLEAHFFSLYAIKSSIKKILIGIAIYLIFVRKVLRKSSEYINPTLKWFNILDYIYKPIGRVVFRLGLIVFKIIDEALVGTAVFVAKMAGDLGKIEIEYRKNIIESIKNRINFGVKSISDSTDIESIKNKINVGVKSIRDTKDMIAVEKVRYSIGERIVVLSQKMNSINYSIFIFACILVVCLITLIRYA